MFECDENGYLQVKNVEQLHKRINNYKNFKHNRVVAKDILFYQLCDLFKEENERVLRIKLTNIYGIHFYKEEEIKMFMKEVIKFKKENQNKNFKDIINFLIINKQKVSKIFNSI